MRYFVGVPKVGPQKRRFVGDMSVGLKRAPFRLYDTSSDQIFAGFTTPPTDERKRIIDNLVKKLKEIGVWYKLDVFYAFAAADRQAGRVNWIQPGTYNCSEVNVPVFTVDQGFTGLTNAYLDTQFNPRITTGAKYLRDSASVFGYSVTSPFSNGGMVGHTGGIVSITPRGGSNYTYYRVNLASDTAPFIGDAFGLWSATRPSSTVTELYLDGAIINTASPVASINTPNENIHFLKRHASEWFFGTAAIGGVGGNLDANDQFALYNALKVYLNAIAYTSVNPETEQILALSQRPALPFRKKLIDDTITGLKYYDLWSKLDIAYFYATTDIKAAKTNWKAPGTFIPTDVNPPVYMLPNVGVQGDNFGKGYDIGWIPSVHGVNYQQNYASIHAWIWSDYRLDGSLDIYSGAGSQPTAFISAWANSVDSTGHALNDATGATAFSPGTDGVGLYSLSRTGSANYTVTKNSALLGTQARPSTGRPAVSAKAPFGYARFISFHAWGAGFSANDNINLYNIVSNYMAGVTALRVAANINPLTTPARLDAMRTLIKSLMNAGVWEKLDVFYVLAASESQIALVNWRNPGTSDATAINAPTFTPDRGFTGTASGYIDTNYNPTSGPRFTQNSAVGFAWSLTAGSLAGGIIGHLGASAPIAGDMTIYPHLSGLSYYLMNQATNATVANTDGTGLYAVNRSGAAALQLYKNGVFFGTSSIASDGIVSANRAIFKRGGDTLWQGQAAAAGFGRSMSNPEQTALYNALRDYLITTGAISQYQPESEVIFAGMVTPPTTARKAIIDQLVKALKNGGQWTKLDGLYLFAAADSQAALLNWINPATYLGVTVGSPAFATDKGFTGGNVKYIGFGFNPTTAPTPKFTQNSAHISAYANSNIDIDGGIIGTASGVDVLYPRFGNAFYGRVNNSANNLTGASTDAIGFWIASRFSATSQEVDKNGLLLTSNAGASVAPANEAIEVLRAQVKYWTGQVSAASFGSSLTGSNLYYYSEYISNYLAGVMGGKIMDDEAITLFDNMGGMPAVQRRIAINNCMASLKASGVWAKLDSFYMFAADSSNSARCNWRTGGYLSAINSPTFTVDIGFLGGGTAYLDTGYNLATATSPVPKYSMNSGCMFALSHSDILSGNPIVSDAGGMSELHPRFPDGAAYGNLNTNTGPVFGIVPDGMGLYSITRSASDAMALYKNGVSIGTGNTAAGAMPTTMWFMRRFATYWPGRIVAGGHGAHLNAADQVALYNAINTYRTEIVTLPIFNASDVPPTALRQAQINACVLTLINAGIWEKLDTFYLFAAADSQAAVINWKKPGFYNATNMNSSAFVADRGFTGGTPAYVDSGFNPTTAAGSFVQDSATAFAWSNTNADIASAIIGLAVGSNQVQIIPRNGGNTSHFINSSAVTQVANTDSTGLFSVSRTAAAVHAAYRNGALIASGVTTSIAVPNENIAFLRRSGNYWTGQIAAGGFGAGLNAAEQLTLYNALRTYMTGVGVP